MRWRGGAQTGEVSGACGAKGSVPKRLIASRKFENNSCRGAASEDSQGFCERSERTPGPRAVLVLCRVSGTREIFSTAADAAEIQNCHHPEGSLASLATPGYPLNAAPRQTEWTSVFADHHAGISIPCGNSRSIARHDRSSRHVEAARRRKARRSSRSTR